MISSITIILSAIVLVGLMPLVLAGLYLQQDRLNALSSALWQKVLWPDRLIELSSASWHKLLWRFRNVGPERLKLQREASAKYLLMQDLLVGCRQSCAASIAMEKHLVEQLTASRAKAEAMDQRAAQKPDNNMVKERAIKLRGNCAQIEHRLQQQELQTEVLRTNLIDLESKLQAAFAQKQILIAQDKFGLGSRHVQQALSGQAIQRAQSIIEKMELKVSEREARAVEIRARASQVPSPDTERIERLIAAVIGIGQRLNSIAGFARAVDPSVERAYARLDRQCSLARTAADASLKDEDKIENRLNGFIFKEGEWQERASWAISQGKHDEADELLRKIVRSEANSTELSTALRTLRRHNMFIHQRLFRIEGIVRRLFVVKLLLAALPGSKKDELVQYTKLADAAFEYLTVLWQKDDTQVQAPIDFADKLAALEHRTLRTFIHIAKVESKKLPPRAASQLRKNISAVSETLETEKQAQQNEFDRWDRLAKQALEEKKEFSVAVLSQRREQAATILQALHRSLEVLSLTQLAMDKGTV